MSKSKKETLNESFVGYISSYEDEPSDATEDILGFLPSSSLNDDVLRDREKEYDYLENRYIYEITIKKIAVANRKVQINITKL